MSDPRWHKRPPNKKQSDTKQKPPTVKDARKNIKRKPTVFSKRVFSDSTEEPSKRPRKMKVTTTTYTQTKPKSMNAIIQTDLSIEKKETSGYCDSRVDANISVQEETQSNIEPPTMARTQLEASHEIIVDEIVATIDKETNTEAEEDTPFYRKNIHKVLGVNFIPSATR